MQEPSNGQGVPATRSTALDQASLGTPIAVFRPSLHSRIVIGVCAGVLLVAGVFIALYLGGSYIYGTFLVSTAVLILFLAFALGRTYVLIGPNGLIRIKGGRQDSCRWEELREIVVSVPTAGGVKVAFRRCALVKRDGSRIELLDVNVGHFEAMVDAMRRLSQPRHVAWKEEIVTPGSGKDTVVMPNRLDWVRWLIYGLIGLTILLLLFTVEVRYKYG